MKYTSKNENYESPNPSQGIFTTPFATTSQPKKWIDKNGEINLTINFDLRYLKNNTEVTIEKEMVVQFREHQTTLILNENDEEEDLQEFLLRGGTYDRERILKWGRPSAEMMESEYLDPLTLWSNDIQLTVNEPQRTIAKDWIDDNIMIQGVRIGSNFQLQEDE